MLIATLVFVLFVRFRQHYLFEGQLFQLSDNAPLPDTDVVLMGTGCTSKSDSLGHFQLDCYQLALQSITKPRLAIKMPGQAAAWCNEIDISPLPLSWVVYLPADPARCPVDVRLNAAEKIVTKEIKAPAPGELSKRYLRHFSIGGWGGCVVMVRHVNCWHWKAPDNRDVLRTIAWPMKSKDREVEVDEVGVGRSHWCVRSHGSVLCAGSNAAGQLGAGRQTQSSNDLTPIADVDDAVSLAIYDDATCISRAQGGVWCTGRLRYPGWGSTVAGDSAQEWTLTKLDRIPSEDAGIVSLGPRDGFFLPYLHNGTRRVEPHAWTDTGITMVPTIKGLPKVALGFDFHITWDRGVSLLDRSFAIVPIRREHHPGVPAAAVGRHRACFLNESLGYSLACTTGDGGDATTMRGVYDPDDVAAYDDTFCVTAFHYTSNMNNLLQGVKCWTGNSEPTWVPTMTRGQIEWLKEPLDDSNPATVLMWYRRAADLASALVEDPRKSCLSNVAQQAQEAIDRFLHPGIYLAEAEQVAATFQSCFHDKGQ